MAHPLDGIGLNCDRARDHLDTLEKEFDLKLPTLSMGMTNDFLVAVEEGATLVRVGTAIFGERSRRKEL